MLKKALCLAALLALPALPVRAEPVKIAFNPQTYAFLPIFVAIEKGLFKQYGVEVRATTYAGSALSQVPLLARGDLDIAPMVAAPPFFNQYAQGFGVKLVASLTQAHRGWHDTTWLLVRKDVWESGAIKTFADLKGRAIETGPKGSPMYLTVTEALKQGGLTLKDVAATERLRALSDAFPIFRNKAADVMPLAEPIAGRLVAEGLAVRWKASYEIMPWFQESYLAATSKFIAERRTDAKKFLMAIFAADRIITDAKGKWTPELAAITAKYAGLKPEDILKIPGPQHVGQMGRIDRDSLAKLQAIWMAERMVRTKTPIGDMVDTTVADEARKELGIE
ncbi:MAG: ABC transporter substrate-binding protein [Rhodospirillaceae bacterium]|nr:ABC transporter substrate-binding protein [Rhodospirillaceae bacterium]